MTKVRTVRLILVSKLILALTAVSSFLLLGSGCYEEIVPEPYVPSDAHDGYVHGLRQAGLLDTALGREWLAAAESSLSQAVEVTLPFVESLYMDPAQVFAVGYRFRAHRGQRIEVEARIGEGNAIRLFMDLFRLPAEPQEDAAHVASGDPDQRRLVFEARDQAVYLLRIQSELLRGGHCSLTIRNVASLRFPVVDRTTQSILSGFGAPRDAGKRAHHGVDIFAPRHTQVLAPSRAYVARVGESALGGLHVWLRDQERSLSFYFAHLQTQNVSQGTWVEAGDLVGTVGNSGNARTTKPHLHFGIYARGFGPIDPYHFVHEPKERPQPVAADLRWLGLWARTNKDEVALRERPSRRGQAVAVLPLHTPFKIWGGTGRSYRVRLPDGPIGYVPTDGVELAANPLRRNPLQTERVVLDKPASNASRINQLAAGEEISVLGAYGEYLFVDMGDGRTGWLTIED